MEAWKDLRFGMFIHWGPVSQTGKEIGWSRGGQKGGVPQEQYDNLYKTFNPGDAQPAVHLEGLNLSK